MCAFSPPGGADYGEGCAFPAKGVCNTEKKLFSLAKRCDMIMQTTRERRMQR